MKPIKPGVSALVEGFGIQLEVFSSPDGETIYSPIIDFWIDQSGEESRPIPLITEILASTIKGAIYAAYHTAIAFSDQYRDEVLIFDEDGNCVDELSLTEILDDIHDQLDANREVVPENAIIH